MNIIEYALQAYLQTSDGASDTVASAVKAVPAYNGWTGVVYLTAAGEFILRDDEADPPRLRPETDQHMQMVALVEAAVRFPILTNLLPSRSNLNSTCHACQGTGKFYPRNATGWLYCPECHGLGWPGVVPAPLPLQDLDSNALSYPPFDEAVRQFEQFLRRQDIVGTVRIVPREDITLIGKRAYVRYRKVTEAYANVLRAYNEAARRRLGAGVSAACRLTTGELVAYVYGPVDMDEAMRLMYPDGIRYSVPVNLRQGVIIGNMRANALRVLRRYSNSANSAQEFLK